VIRRLAVLLLCASLCGCEKSKPIPKTDHYVLHPAVDGYPAMIVDSATGCVDALLFGENSDEKKSRFIYKARVLRQDSYAEQCGEPSPNL